MQQFQVRTDLALEATESVKKQEAGEIRGVVMEEYDVLEDVHITKVVVKSKNAQKSLGKPIGTYITLEAASLQENDEDYHREISEELAKQLQDILPGITDCMRNINQIIRYRKFLMEVSHRNSMKSVAIWQKQRPLQNVLL